MYEGSERVVVATGFETFKFAKEAADFWNATKKWPSKLYIDTEN